jgi:hypothetical protein
MAKILEKINKVHTGFPQSAKHAKLLKALKESAIEAVVRGVGSEAGKAYMSMFADSEEQLNLLTNPNNVEGMPWLHEVQAYLLANAMCAPITNGQTGNGIFKTAIATDLEAVDAKLSTTVEASVVERRPKEFQELFPV